MENTNVRITELDKKAVETAVAKILETSKKRNFEQTIEVGVNLEGINFKTAQNRIEFAVAVPSPFRAKPKLALFAKDTNLINQLKGSFTKIITADEIPSIDKKAGKKLASEIDIFFAEPAVMALVGKHLGQVLAPRGKMPRPVPPQEQAITAMSNAYVRDIKISNKKGKNLPTLHFPVGKEKMSVASLSDNFFACYNKLVETLPGNTQNIKSMYIKTTMGSPLFLFKR